MDLQNTFYIIGIVYMSLSILLLIVIGVILFYVWQKISDIYDKIDANIKRLSHAVDQPGEVALNVGATLAEKAVRSMKKMLEKTEK